MGFAGPKSGAPAPTVASLVCFRQVTPVKHRLGSLAMSVMKAENARVPGDSNSSDDRLVGTLKC